MPQWRDLDVWLRQKRDGDILDMSEVDAIKNSLYNIFTTEFGTRRMLYEFANITSRLLFEPIDETTSARLRESAFDAIARWEDRVSIRSLEVVPDPDNHAYRLDVIFTLKTAHTEVHSFSYILQAA